MKYSFFKIRFLALLLLCFSFAGKTMAQDVSTKGYDFYFGMMANATSSDIDLMLTSASDRDAFVVIDIPGLETKQKIKILPFNTVSIQLPESLIPDRVEATLNNAVHISSTEKITVQVLNNTTKGGDASTIYPLSSLRDKYVVLTYGEPALAENILTDQILIVAIEDNSQIQITPAANTASGKTAGVPYTIVLNKGESHQIIHENKFESLSGTIIEDKDSTKCLRFAVFSGNYCTTIGGCASCSHLFEQVIPEAVLGKDYILVPMKQRNTAAYRIMATQDSTTVKINQGSGAGITLHLNKGQIHQFFNNVTSYVAANQPVAIMQYAQGKECDGPEGIGNPFQLQMHGNHQLVQDAYFTAFGSEDNAMDTYWLNIITKTSDVGKTYLNGQNIAHEFKTAEAFPDYSYAQVNTSHGIHHLSNSGGLIAYFYAWGDDDSYAFSAGVNLKVLSPDTNKLLQVTTSGGDLCMGTSMQLSAKGFPSGGKYTWFPKGGHTADIQVQPKSDMVYRVTYDHPAFCPIAEDTAMVSVKTYPKVEIISRNTNVGCGLGEEIWLSARGADTYRWWTAAGENYGDSSEVSVKLTQSLNKIFLEGSNQWGCKDTTDLIWYAGKCCELFIPNAFSPNGDGVNDYFFAHFINPVNSYRMEIFDRYGQKLFIARNANDHWDGTLNGVPVAVGTYFYKVSGTCVDGSLIDKKGSIILIR